MVSEPVRWRLPAPYEYLAGREPELVDLDLLLVRQRLLVLRGLAGVGKSQLAAHLLARASRERPIVAWLRGRPPGVFDDVRSFGMRVGCEAPNEASDEQALLALADWLEGNEGWLLAFDDVADARALAPLFERSLEHGNLIVTTTDGSWVEPGHVHVVEVLATDTSSRFLLDRTGEDGVASETAAHSLGERMEGLPLALRQCEAWVRSGHSTLSAYAELFEQRAEALLRSGPGPLDHRSTVAVTFDLAVAQAERRQAGSRELLRALAYLSSDGFPRRWLRDEFGDAYALDAQVRALSASSLLELFRGTLAVHGLVREVARETAPETVQEEALRRVRTWLLEAVPDQALEVDGWDAYSLAVGHLDAVADHLLRIGLSDSATVLLLDRLATFHQARGRYGEARHRFEQAVKSAQGLPEDDEQRERAHGDLALLVSMMDATEGIPMLEEVVERRQARADEDPGGLADALNNLGFALGPRDAKRSAAVMREAVAIYSRLYEEKDWPDRQPVLHGLMNLGLALWRDGDNKGAEREWLRVLELMKRSRKDRRDEMATTSSNLGVVYDNRGDGIKAVEHSQRGFDLTIELYGQSHPVSVLRLINLGGALRVRSESGGEDDLHTAMDMHRRAERLAGDLEPPAKDLVALALNNLGVDLLKAAEPEKALEPLQRALALRRDLAGGEPDGSVAQSLGNVAKAQLDARHVDDAQKSYEGTLVLCDELALPSSHERRALAWDGLGDIAMRRKRFAVAVEHYRRAYEAFRESMGEDTTRTRRARGKLEQAQEAAAGDDRL